MNRRTLCGILAAGVIALSGASAFGQVGAGGTGAEGEPVSLRPPTPSREEKPPLIWNYLALIVLGGLAIGAAMIPSKRGHQD